MALAPFNGCFEPTRWADVRGPVAVCALSDIRKKCIESRSDDDISRMQRELSRRGRPRLPAAFLTVVR